MRMPIEFNAITEHETHMTIEEFREAVSRNAFIDYDGFGSLATATKKSNLVVTPSSIAKEKCIESLWGSQEEMDIPSWATHVVWYNK